LSTVNACGVGVHYLFDRQQRTVSPTIAPFRRSAGSTWALRDVSFSIGAGEGVALLGSSGSGKSTLLRVLANVLEADEGSIDVRGQIGSLLSVHAGVMAALTGRENALLLGVLAGRSTADSRASIDEVKELSGLGSSFERLVASYSQGMRARLGLAIIESTSPQVLLLDEIHEALDHEYRDHIAQRAERLIANGGVVVAAGHDHPMLRRMCSRALWLRDGHIERDDEFDAVQAMYLGRH
jgi:ABC-type polysaccharide/polyol phosphate transport system ATPase subunit